MIKRVISGQISNELEPRMCHDLIDGQALARVGIYHQSDKFFAFSTNFVPLSAIEYRVFLFAAENSFVITVIIF